MYLLRFRYLYVNSRAWPAGCVISDPMSPPPIAEEIDMHVIDLKSLREERRSLRAHRAFTPNDECFFIFLDVSRDFVARYIDIVVGFFFCFRSDEFSTLESWGVKHTEQVGLDLGSNLNRLIRE